VILAGRDLLLWALACFGATHALLAWRAMAPAAAAGLAVLYALALGAAGPIGSRLHAGLGGLGRGRARILLGLAHAALVLIAPLAVGAAPALLPRAALLFAWLQLPALLLAVSETALLAVLMNAGVLVLLAALHGGLPAASAVSGFVSLLAAFLVVDHWALTLAAHPRVRAPAWGVVARQALSLALPVGLGSAALFLLFPPQPAEFALATPGRSDPAQPLGAAHRLLILTLFLGGAGIVTAVRLFRKDPPGAAPLVEAPELLSVEDEALPAPQPAAPVTLAGPRGRILRAYARFLGDAARRALRRHPPETPLEFARRVGEPMRPLQALTELFMGARYGAAEPAEPDAVAAERAAREIRAAWSHARRR
jgi:putative flippase GtrA